MASPPLPFFGGIPIKSELSVNTYGGLNDHSSLPNSARSDNFHNPPNRTFASPKHSQEILRALNGLRTQKLLCDATVVAGGRHFMAHRVVLCSASPYFHSIFTQGNNMREVMLQTVVPEGLEQILEYTYTSKIILTLENVEPVLNAAVLLEMKEVTEICQQYLQTAITTLNCIDVMQIARRHQFFQLIKTCEEFVLDHFPEVAEQAQFQTLTADQVAYFLSQDRVGACTELQLFGIAAKWIEYDMESRGRWASQLMHHIRFPLIATDDLVDSVQSYDFMLTDPECHRYLLEALNYHLIPQRQNSMQSPRTKLRSTNQVVLAVGGERARHQASNYVLMYVESQHSWKRLTSMPLKRVDHCVAVLNHFLYVVGGQVSLNSNGKDSIGTVHRYDPRFNTWLQICPMQQRRAFFCLVPMGGCLYAIGGKNEHGPLATTECYTPQDNRWSFATNMDCPVYAHAASTLHGRIYVSGGFRNRLFSDSLQAYQPGGDGGGGQWGVLQPMGMARGFHAMCTLGERVYAMGGNRVDDFGQRVDVLSAERYSSETGQWTALAPLLTAVGMAGVATLGLSHIYVIGGYNGAGRHRQRDIQRYDCARDEWDPMQELPEPLLRTACCTLTLPHHLISHMAAADSRSVTSRHSVSTATTATSN